MASAIGSSSRPGTGPSGSTAPNIYNVQSFGAVPGSLSGCDAGIAAALAKMDADDPTRNQAKVLYFPGNPQAYYTLSTVFLCRNNLTVRGDGPAVSRVSALGSATQHHVFVGGIQPNGAGGPNLDPNHYVDLFGKLDTTIANATGKAWGIRTGTDTLATFWGGAFDVPRPFGDTSHPGNWKHFRKLTINLCLDLGAGTLTDGPICGLGDQGGAYTTPWRLYKLFFGGTHLIFFSFCTGEAPNTVRQCYFSVAGVTGIVRITFQIDLTTATMAAWVGSAGAAPVRVAVTPYFGTGAGGLSFTSTDGLVFADNPGSLFVIGSWTDTGSNRGGNPVMDLSVYGLAICQDLLYDPTGAAGSAQTVHPSRLAADGATITDATRYRRNQSTGALIAQLALTNNATTNLARPTMPTGLAGRSINYTSGSLWSGGGTATGLFQFVGAQAQLNLGGSMSGLAFRDITINASSWAGDAISHGSMYTMSADNVSLAGARGIGCAHMGAAYWFDGENITINGTDACIHGYWTFYRFQRIQMDGSYNSLVFARGCLFHLDRGFTGSQVGMYLFNFRWAGYAGNHRITNFMSDNEASNLPEKASFSVDLIPNFATVMHIRDCQLALCDPRAVFLEVLTPATQQPQDVASNNVKRSSVDVRRVDLAESRVLVRSDSPLWVGTVATDFRNDDIDPIEPLSADGLLGVTYLTSDFTCPPSARSWTPNCLVEPVLPVRGLHRRYRPVTAGRYGTTTPPVWEGESLVSSSGAELGAFSTGSSSTLATILASRFGNSGPAVTITPDWGSFTQLASNRMLDFWLRGVIPAVPTALRLTVSFKIRSPIEPGNLDWITGVNVTGGFAAATARVSTNTGTITFPLPTGDSGKPYLSVFLEDQLGAVIWTSVVPWQTPFSTSASLPPVTIAPGGIVVTGSAATGTSATGLFDKFTGGFTTYAWNAILDYWHRSAALPIPTALCLGLSTGLANREGSVSEPSGNGYARVVLSTADIALANRGRSLLANAKSFPVATGSDWPTVQSVFLSDAPSGGVVIAHMNLVQPRIARVGGPALSFAPGALVFVL